MTLLDKQTCLYKSGLALLLIPFFFACDDPSQIGVEVPNTDDQYEVKKAEFSLPVSTISIDSLRTDNTSFSIFGQYSDPVTGKVTATSYNRYRASGGHLPESENLQVRAYVVLSVNNFRQDNNVIDDVVNIHEAEDSLFFDAIYLADRMVPFTQEPMATDTYTFQVSSSEPDSTISFDLGENFTNFHYQLLLRSNEDSESRDSLTGNDYFRKPLVFSPGINNSGLYSIDLQNDTTGIYLEMIDDNLDTTYYYKFTFDTKHYSHISRDRSSSLLSDLTEEYQVSSNAGGFAYVDVMSGVYAKVGLTPLLEFIESNEEITVNSAVLSNMSAENDPSYVDPFNVLQFLFIKDNGKINGPGLLDRNDIINNIILSDASYTNFNNPNFTPTSATSIYSDSLDYAPVNVTLFTESLLNNYLDKEDYLTEEVVIFSGASSSLNQTKLIGSETKLTLYYTIPKE